MSDKKLRVLASVGLAVGGIFGMAGTFAPSAALRGLAWGLDGSGLVMASALLAVYFYRKGQDLAAAGFLVFAVGQGLVVSGSAMELAASVPSFGAGAGLWAVALALISSTDAFPLLARVLGFIASALFAATALQIYAGVPLLPTATPLPAAAFPVFVATFALWIWTLLRTPAPPGK